MKGLLLLLFCHLSAMALPTAEEASSLLSSPSIEIRAKATHDIWQSGTLALPLLKKLLHDPHPEVSERAGYLFQKVKMGLTPTSAPELLQLNEALEKSNNTARTPHLIKLLEHPDGILIAVNFLDQWTRHQHTPPHQLRDCAEQITETLLERRKDWQKFFTSDLSAPCRALLIAQIARQNPPFKNQMITILAASHSEAIYSHLKENKQRVSPSIIKAFARLAITENKLPLAMRMLSENLPHAKTHDHARAIAFLEKSAKVPCPTYEGKWQDELLIYQARAHREPERVLALNSRLEGKIFFQYENHLTCGKLKLPQPEKENYFFKNALGLKALHRAYATPPQPIDIEALTADTQLDWKDLARTLTLLAKPQEASDTLFTNGQRTSAVSLLWHSNQPTKALHSAKETLTQPNQGPVTKMRLTLSSLYLNAGERERAKKIFTPILTVNSLSENDRRRAISLGLQLFPREELLPLAPRLRSKIAPQRALAIAPFLPYPPKVSAAWYEYFLDKNPSLPPVKIFQKIDSLLNEEQEKAQKIVAKQLQSNSKNILLPTDTLYQNALFLKLPQSLKIIKKAAWHQLSIHDLLRLIKDKSWPQETRIDALKTALLIAPTHPSLHWYALSQGGQLPPETIHHLTLGDPHLSLQLAALTGKRDSLKLTAELADLRDPNSIRCLNILAKSYLDHGHPIEAVRLYQIALFGEIAIGTQPATPIQTRIDNLGHYLEARRQITPDLQNQKFWEQRQQDLGKTSTKN